MKNNKAFYEKNREDFINILDKHIEEVKHLIERTHKSKDDGYLELHMQDCARLSRIPYVVFERNDIFIKEGTKESEIEKYDKYKALEVPQYYVYVAYGIEEEVLYVGKGSGNRYKHCNSGVSSSYELNEYHFNLKPNEDIRTEIVKYFTKDEDALLYERDLIYTLKPMFNKSF